MIVESFLGLNFFNLVIFACFGLARNCSFFVDFYARVEAVIDEGPTPLAALANISFILLFIVGWKEILVLAMFNDIRKAVTKS